MALTLRSKVLKCALILLQQLFLQHIAYLKSSSYHRKAKRLDPSITAIHSWNNMQQTKIWAGRTTERPLRGEVKKKRS